MGRQRLPSVEWDLARGEVTKANPIDVGAAAIELGQNADGFSELGAIGQIPGSTRVSEPAGVALESIHYFEAYRFSGELVREKLVLAGTDFKRLNDDETLTLLKSGLVAEPLSSARALDRMHVVSPKNEPFKYDGDSTSPWGVQIPGGHRLLLQSINDSTEWTVTGGSKSDAAGVGSGDGSMQVDKDVTSTDTLSASHTFAANQDVSGGGLGLIYVWLLVPEGALAKLDQASHAVEMALTDGAAATSRWRKTVGDLSEGRNLLTFATGSPDVDGTIDLTDIDSVTLDIVTDGFSATHDGFRWDDLYITTVGVPSLSDGGAGNVTNKVTYRVTFTNSTGQESNAGPVSAIFDATGGKIVVLSDIPTSPDNDVIARTIYRDSDQGTGVQDQQWLRVVRIADNTTTSYSDDISDASRSSVQPPLSSDTAKDYSLPPRMQQVINYGGYMIGINADRRFEINFSYKNRPEAWPADRLRQFPTEVVALIPHVLGLIIASTDRAWIMSGNEWSNFRFDPLTPTDDESINVGVTGFRAFAPFKRIAYFMHDDGAYLQDGVDPWYIAAPIRDAFDALDASLFRDAIVVNDRARFRVLYIIGDTIKSFVYGKATGEVSGEGYGIDPLDGRQGSWFTIKLPAGITVKDAAIVETGDKDKPECWIACSDGFVYWLGDPSAVDFANGYGSSAVECDIQTGWASAKDQTFFLARFFNVNTSTSAASRWTITVETAREPDATSSSKGYFSQTFTVDLKSGSDSKEIPLKKDPEALRGQFMRLRLQNSNLGEDGIFREVLTEVVPKRIRRRAA